MKIELKNMGHTYPTGDKALEGIDLLIDQREPVAIIGQNGAGKTTLVKHFNGILRPTSGDILLDGESIENRSTAKWSKDVGYVFQNSDDQLFLDTVRKELEFGPRQIGMPDERIAEQLEYVSKLCDLADKLDDHPFDLTSTQKKFCTVGAIIMMDPQVLIFDEPTCGQDIKGTKRLCDIVKAMQEKGKLCITISHDMKFVVENFTRTIVLCKGSVLLDGSTKEVFAQPDILKKSFVSPPPLTRVAQQAGISDTIFDIKELINVIDERREQRI